MRSSRSSPLPKLRAWESPASGPFHSIPSWHGTAIGVSLSRTSPEHPLAGPWNMWRSNFWIASHEISLCPLRQPDEASVGGPARARLALGRLLLSGVRLRDGDADQCVRNT